MIHILTSCSRPHNITKMSTSIPKDAHWVILYDDKIKFNEYVSNAEYIKCPSTGFVGSEARNYFFDNYHIDDNDWIYILDDDNIIHPEWYDNIKLLLDTNYSIIHWGQVNKNNSLRLSPIIKINQIDSACYMVKWKNNRKVRHDITRYNHDGIYAEECALNGEVYTINKNLCYYNFLRNPSKPTNNIDGWFNYSLTYDYLVSTIPSGGKFIECGAWLGKSSSYLCDIAQNKINIYIIDTWKGSINELETNHKLAQEKDVFSLFIENMGERKFIPIISDGVIAASKFDDNSCDVVFIDMEHTYEAVKKDIDAWLPKVKIGGYIAGHDYESNWQGVVDAVNEKFGRDNLILKDTCWIYKKLH